MKEKKTRSVDRDFAKVCFALLLDRLDLLGEIFSATRKKQLLNCAAAPAGP
jgi:hypothetical protein